MPSQTHPSLYLDSKFGNFVLKTNKTPKPGPGELLVRIEAAGLNPVDWKIQKYGMFIESYPVIVGTDVAGTVEEVGQGVSSFAKGDRVLYQGSWAEDRAGYQQYNLIDASTAAKIPSNISLEEAASIPVAIGATVIGLYNPKPQGAGLVAPFEASKRGHEAGKPFFVFGGATSVGQYVIQFAKLSGFSPIITTASLKHEQHLKSLGATHIIDRHNPLSSLPDEIAKITTKPFEIVFDAISASETQEAGYNILSEGGTMIVVLTTQVKSLTSGKNIIHVFGVFTLPETRELGVQFYSQLEAMLKEGVIRPNRVEVVPGGLNGVVPGLERLQSDQVSGTKLIVRPQETIV
ncbi:chaperonin 10-like protein [Collybia nuda]|uniref:Chaperonin 10-like protein n=1 Tax=Collybia nuda TaxID=64659 RepID=A0A9P5Y606_9AGAR|nr:chaperonin 10-like protein [Collybia nuda]